MAGPKKKMSLLTSAATTGNARPHPGPLPRGEGETLSASRRNGRSRLNQAAAANGLKAEVAKKTSEQTAGAPTVLPLPGERAGVRADDASAGKLPVPDFQIWQLCDSAFPTGGFAHSSGLEAAWQHGEVRGRAELVSFIEASLDQLGHAGLPFVMAAFDAPDKLTEFDSLSDVFTTNHVANRASRAQGRAFLTAVERIFPERRPPARLGDKATQKHAVPEPGAPKSASPFAHFAPVFGACLRQLNLSRATTARMFFFNHLRSVLAAAVRLNIVGPMEAQMLQNQLAAEAERVRQQCENLSLDQIAQTAPLLDLWQGAQDRLYSRLFQS
jgi:urease accessory protein